MEFFTEYHEGLNGHRVGGPIWEAIQEREAPLRQKAYAGQLGVTEGLIPISRDQVKELGTLLRANILPECKLGPSSGFHVAKSLNKLLKRKGKETRMPKIVSICRELFAVCGGACVSEIFGVAPNDIDVFIVNHGRLSEEVLHREISHFISINLTDTVGPVDVYSTRFALTCQSQYPHDITQFILRDYTSLAQVLLGFDIRVCGFGYYMNQLYATESALYELVNRCLMISVKRASSSFVKRIVKYASKGFNIYVEGLEAYDDIKLLNQAIEGDGFATRAEVKLAQESQKSREAHLKLTKSDELSDEDSEEVKVVSDSEEDSDYVSMSRSKVKVVSDSEEDSDYVSMSRSKVKVHPKREVRAKGKVSKRHPTRDKPKTKSVTREIETRSKHKAPNVKVATVPITKNSSKTRTHAEPVSQELPPLRPILSQLDVVVILLHYRGLLKSKLIDWWSMPSCHKAVDYMENSDESSLRYLGTTDEAASYRHILKILSCKELITVDPHKQADRSIAFDPEDITLADWAGCHARLANETAGC
jgi:hypothetical protein